MFARYLPSQLTQKLELLPFSRDSRSSAQSTTRYSRLGGNSPRLGHRRQLSISTFSSRGATLIAATCLLILATLLLTIVRYVQHPTTPRGGRITIDESAPIPLGQSIWPGGREVFWWERFPKFKGYYKGLNHIVPLSQYQPEQAIMHGEPPLTDTTTDLKSSYTSRLVAINVPTNYSITQCRVTAPRMYSYRSLPQNMPAPLLGSMEEMGIDQTRCYDRINRLAPYGLGFSDHDGGVGVELYGNNEGVDMIEFQSPKNVKWNEIQEDCVRMNKGALQGLPRTVFMLRTYHDFDYTPHHILMLRALMAELSLRTGGQISLHFLIQVRDDTIPIFASKEVYNQTLADSLPAEFAGMGTLWTVAQMRMVYPGPFPESIVNFSGDELYGAYRSLHFPLQYWASKHPNIDYIWQWEMDIRVTGHYGELIERITSWADAQPSEYLWERNARLFIPSLYNNSYAAFSEAVAQETTQSGQQPISGPQLNSSLLLQIPDQPETSASSPVITDLITLSPIFSPEHTRWAFHDDITGYPRDVRPPTRAALITASRLSRRLLLLMHAETSQNQHTMFPEMYSASIAFQYGLRAVYAPITTYFDRDWDPAHANEVFNNAPVSAASKKAGMDHGGGHFHGENGSVFGPGEHVFRSATWYSNAAFAGYLWRRWLGEENANGEREWELNEQGGGGRMCLPMMVMHPIKSDT